MGLVDDLILIWISQPLRRTTMSWIELIWVRVVLVTINNHRLSAIPAERRFKYVGRLQVKWARLALESETESLSQSFAFAHVLPSQPSLSLSFCSSRGSFPQYLNVPVYQYPYLCVGLVRSVFVWVWVAGSFWLWLRGVGPLTLRLYSLYFPLTPFSFIPLNYHLFR